MELSRSWTTLCACLATLVPFCVGQGTPVIIWHGLGDYADSGFMNHYKEIIEANTEPGTFIHSLQIGDTPAEQIAASYLKPVDEQVEEVCAYLRGEPAVQDGYHSLGWSQGGQFLRGVAERCPTPPMRNLVTMGSQHQGVFGIPGCIPDEEDNFCDQLREGLFELAYTDLAQEHLVPAEYWHDSLHEDVYAEKSAYIGVINNEGDDKNETYKENLERLETFVMLKYTEDTTVIPRESSHFDFYEPGSDTEIRPLRESPIYLEDWIGLQTLDESGRLVFLEEEAGHVNSDDDFFAEEIVIPYLQ